MAKEPRPKGYPKLKNYKPSQFMLPTSHYDKKKADRAVTFIENLCHTKGKWAGTPFWLLPWQEQLIRDIFGIVKPDGNRQFRTAFVEICKKVGKSELAAAVALYLLYADNEPYDFIEKFIMYLSEKYHILEIAVDRWNATQMIQNLEGEGFTIVPFGQGFSSMSAPTKEFYRLLMDGRIIHGGNPVLRWMAGNVVIDTDPAGNIKVTKAKSKEKIDGIVAAIMALDRCIRQEGQSGSVYDERGLLVF